MWYITPERTEVVKVAAVGLIVGIMVPLVGWLLSTLIVNPIFCAGGTAGACSSSDAIGYGVSALLITAAATAILAAQNVYRPLLVTLGAMVALWGLGSYIGSLMQGGWLEYYGLSALLYGLAYTLCYWLLRLRNFALGVVAILAVVVLVRWVLVV